ncbi:phosphoglycerate kinase [Desulfacinum hydrothermale DSM 13146]|uniref:Phosphoglycerate kinase n=1 Tax=Desulfacinum hydrothermale DSM 13146 TaxID=1121390 RepID=A0A1W1XSW0_9BACT|nr:phosphoglycerate kinase [Desulfacinum hydrothermale]SMC26641.1 phosphoglycerate kinase [Desulfacinum hydrothermale DSM 13146]
MKTLDQVDVSGKRVFLRVDFNVPLDKKDGTVADDTRIRAILPSLRKVLDGGGRAVLASHLGRPKGKVVPELSLAPVARHLSGLLGMDVPLAPDCVGETVQKMADQLAPGRVLLLENLRFHEAETRNDPEFSRQLADLADVYVNDAFAVSHRAHASVHGITNYVKECAAGYQLAKEIETFQQAMVNPQRPLAVVIGGAKVSTKIGVLENLIPKVDLLVIGGAMANTFLKAQGKSVGASLVEDEFVDTAKALLDQARRRGVRVLLPTDVTVAPALDAGDRARQVPVDQVPSDGAIFDVGEETSSLIRRALEPCATVVWNGPLGAFETPPFQRATFDLARFLGRSKAFTVVGGGDSASAVAKAGVSDQVGYISTGGGAFLEMLEGKVLPGIAALEKCGQES